MNRRLFVKLCGVLLLSAGCNGCSSDKENNHYEVWQLPSQTTAQMMSYVIRDKNGNVFVVDGGRTEDAQYLQSFLKKLGGVVTGWLITHPHGDHVGALSDILLKYREIRINTIYGSFPSGAWIEQYQPKRFDDFKYLETALEKSGVSFRKTNPGQILGTDSLSIQVLSDINPEIHSNSVNNSSIVYRFHDKTKSVLFLGDLGVEGGNKLLQSQYAEYLSSDYVQMAHHGQRGVSESFYQRVKPTGCLWPTPDWLWDNNAGNGYDTGPWETVRVREWMRKLDVQQHYVMAKGIQQIVLLEMNI